MSASVAPAKKNSSSKSRWRINSASLAGRPVFWLSSRGDSLRSALSAWAAGVTLVTIADDRDDIGTTVSAFIPVSLDPPLVAVSLIADSYPAEVLGRVDRFAVTVLSAAQRALAGRFAVAGRPGARVLLEGTPRRRGEASGALIPDASNSKAAQLAIVAAIAEVAGL